MAKLIYASNMSLDGWTEDERGAFDSGPTGAATIHCVAGYPASNRAIGRSVTPNFDVGETDTLRIGP